ncbi:TetR/AcrR family transcriptional regulator [Streptomyces sp. NBC_01497]|jgi:AcrR family transcriptional regulator|uniref:TetR/AcrR family transcriptional regulator n=1 Tax=Streptomyces sp. NBC_01497 TaxID=2903885 RepID=UPI002E2F6B0A|nr:helix-turn-helix domain-containing protein [Streptomyces sp. NBC_01497]
MKTATRPGTEAEAHRVTRPRADALRNRERIVSAAREIFVEFGPDAPLDEIARRAGIGNATLYRHFPDRSALLVEVVRSVMSHAAEAAERADAEEDDPFAALCRFVHEAADERIGALCTLLSGDFEPHRADVDVERLRLTGTVEAMMDRARQAGRLRADVGHGDLMVALAQLSRPLPGSGCLNTDRFTHRHLQLFLDGMEAPARSALPGRPATLEDLRRANP